MHVGSEFKGAGSDQRMVNGSLDVYCCFHYSDYVHACKGTWLNNDNLSFGSHFYTCVMDVHLFVEVI